VHVHIGLVLGSKLLLAKTGEARTKKPTVILADLKTLVMFTGHYKRW
jgi:hypothetical protein